MKRERRDFDKEFKMMAVNLCYIGKSTKEIAEELGIRADLVRRWKREHEQYGNGSFSGQGNPNLTSEQKVFLSHQPAITPPLSVPNSKSVLHLSVK